VVSVRLEDYASVMRCVELVTDSNAKFLESMERVLFRSEKGTHPTTAVCAHRYTHTHTRLRYVWHKANT
jgi:hypothetical protein